MKPTTNTEGEPGTQDKNTQHEYLDTSRMPDEQEEAPPSTQGEIPSTTFETAPGSFPKPAPSTLALFPEFACSDKCCPSGQGLVIFSHA
ncbi:hypothetical protein HAX54_025807 [Datura stramonium]|uniref:Uncharacterized protein n=1 Tax=Datura stramonium TaxID=4076 RepID=A0ABS8V307_DATST|nr:hypothetical protein [Datura stramonium]